MYHAHFALREEPFGVSPDQRFFMQTEQHREALATLYYAIRQRRGFALLLGSAGLGKTSVLVQLLQMLEDEAETAYLPHPYFDRANVLESILLALGLNATGSVAQDHRIFYKYLTDTRQAGKTCVVIFDEAQGLTQDTLETIRMLSNFETPREKLVQIVLAGQLRLGDTLKRPECEQIRQRLNAIARLAPLTGAEVHAYVSHRLNAAGASIGLFASDALDAVAAASGGVPRNVNTICFNSLTLAYAVGSRQVSSGDVEEAVHDLDLNGDGPAEPGASRTFFAASVPANPASTNAIPEDSEIHPRVTPPPVLAKTPGFEPIKLPLRSAFVAGGMILAVASAFLPRGLQ